MDKKGKNINGRIFEMKKVIALTLAFLMLAAIGSFAETNVNITVNGVRMVFEVPPYIENGRTFVSLRAVAQMLSYEVEWDGEEKRIDIKDGTNTVTLKVGSNEYFVNGDKFAADIPPHIKENRTMVPIRFIAEAFGCAVDWVPETETVEIVKLKNVRVSSAEELLANIGDYTNLILESGTYNLSVAENKNNGNVSPKVEIDYEEYIIKSVTGFSITAAENAEVSVVVEPRYSNVLYFKNCRNIGLEGLTAGHTPDKGYCSGGVFKFEETEGITVKNCRLYGCGTYGITTYGAKGLEVSDTEIYECSYGIVSLVNTADASFFNCVMRDCSGYSMFEFYNSEKIKISSSKIKNNLSDPEYSAFIAADEEAKDIVFENCIFENNTYNEFCNNKNVVFDNCVQTI